MTLHKLKIILIVLLLMVCVKAHTQVNLQEGSFNYTTSDFQAIDRIYSSRSLHQGYFGFGWCSVLEVKRGKTCDYPTNPFSHWKFQFNEKGDLVSWGKTGAENRVLYQKEALTELVLSGLRIKVLWDPLQKRILNLQRSPLHSIEYEYEKGNLINFSGLHPADFKYDTNHNLIELVTANTALKISYNSNTDTVQEIRSTGPCSELYQFSKVDPSGLRTKSEVFKVCRSEPLPEKTLIAQADFEYLKMSTGRYKLVSAKIWRQDQKIQDLKTKVTKVRNAGGPE